MRLRKISEKKFREVVSRPPFYWGADVSLVEAGIPEDLFNSAFLQGDKDSLFKVGCYLYSFLVRSLEADFGSCVNAGYFSVDIYRSGSPGSFDGFLGSFAVTLDKSFKPYSPASFWFRSSRLGSCWILENMKRGE